MRSTYARVKQCLVPIAIAAGVVVTFGACTYVGKKGPVGNGQPGIAGQEPGVGGNTTGTPTAVSPQGTTGSTTGGASGVGTAPVGSGGQPTAAGTAPVTTGAISPIQRAGFPPTGAMSDAQILTSVGQANRAEVAAGTIAVRRAQSASVRGFAATMVSDHRRLEEQGDSVMRQLSLSPAAAVPARRIELASQAEMAQLDSASAGNFDPLYINAQIADHEQTLHLLRSSLQQARNPALRSMLGTAIPVVEAHLAHARQLQQQIQTGHR